MSSFTPYGETLFGDPADRPVSPLSDEFVIPPLSVMNTTLGPWRSRRSAWMSMGIQSDLGRADNLIGAPDLPEYANNGTKGVAPQTSVFDPVLAEVSYRWFCPSGGTVIDPFAGGSVRGIVAGSLGVSYTGIDIRPDQVASNEAQSAAIVPAVAPVWLVGDSYDVMGDMDARSFDYLLTCPPYADLEVYSDDPLDLSVIASADYHAFVSRYRHIIYRASKLLRDDAFATIVVGDLRDRRGYLRNFVGDTVSACADAGLHLYNDAILVNSIGTAALRAGRQFRAGRKLVRHHQSVLTFVKGDSRAAVRRISAAA